MQALTGVRFLTTVYSVFVYKLESARGL